MSESARIQVEVIRGGKIVETKAYTGDTIEIGKLSRSDLRLDDENISRRHARIEIDRDGRVQLIDLGSTNGTRLNGMRVNKAFLTDGDELFFLSTAVEPLANVEFGWFFLLLADAKRSARDLRPGAVPSGYAFSYTASTLT